MALTSRLSFTLQLTSATGWRIGNAGEGRSRFAPLAIASTDPRQVAQELAEALRAAGYRSGPILVALPTKACLCAAVSTAGIPRRGRREAMLYRLEEKLPLAAEDIAADFIVHNGTALGICVPTQQIGPILEGLSGAGIELGAICPSAILALQGARRLAEVQGISACDAVLWQENESIDLLRLEEGHITAWLALPAEPRDVALALESQVLQRKSTLRLATVNASDELTLKIDSLPDIQVVDRFTCPADQATLIASRQILSGRESPPVDLRSSNWGAGYPQQRVRQALFAAAAALVLLCGCLAGAQVWRASRYAVVARQADDRKAAVFHKLFPNEPLPIGVESRLRSAQRQLHGSQPTSAIAAGPDALESLHEVLAHLPAQPRFRIDDLSIESGRIILQGEVLSHGDADAIASALRRSPGLTIDDPLTQQLTSDAVQFSIAGTVRAAKGQEARKSP